MGKLLMHYKKGFTIVELLIVIVVIAILATISIVVYSGIQQRAFNTSMIAQAKQTHQIFQLYISGESPQLPGGALCATVAIECTRTNSVVITADNTGLLNAMRKYGSPISSVERASDDYYGLYFDNWNSRTVEGVPDKAILIYYLRGENQECGMQALKYDPNSSTNMLIAPRAENWTASSNGVTRCYTSIAGSRI